MGQSDLWAPTRRIEQAFTKAMHKLMRRLIRLVKGIHDPANLIDTLREYAQSPDFRKYAEAAARKMITGLFRDMGRTWRQAAAHHGMGRKLYLALMQELKGSRGGRLNQLITETTFRITSLPTDLGKDVATYVERESFKGRRASDIAQEIEAMFPERTTAKANMIARTQVSYAHTNLIRSRAESLGIDWYQWKAVGGERGDGRTRHAHRKISGVLVKWTDPPAPEDLFPEYTKEGRKYKNSLGHYHAGQCPNCRCYPAPIVDLDTLAFPARVYRNGKISIMNRKQFEQIMR